MLREKITPLFMLCAKCNMFCTQDLVGIKQALKFGAPAIGGYLKEVQKCKISLVHIRSVQDPGQVELNPALGVCIFEVCKIRAKWNLTRL